jgi:hypothetical protein
MSNGGRMLYYPLKSVNTYVEGSKMTGDNKAQFFNIQALKIVSAYVYLTIIVPGDFTQTVTNSVSVYDKNTKLPLQLGPGDVIVGMVIDNISGGEIIYYSAPPPAPKIQFFFSTQPTDDVNLFNPDFPVWNGGTNGEPITNVIEIENGARFNTGFNAPIQNKGVINPYCWINCEITNPISILSLVPETHNLAVLGITFLIMNSNLPQ